MSFGRKGLAPGEVAPAPGGGFGRADPALAQQAQAQQAAPMDAPAGDADVAAAREAFIAAERERAGKPPVASAEPEDPMAAFRNAARPQPAQPLGLGVNAGGGSTGGGMSAQQEAEIRAAARSMSGRAPARSSSGSSGFIFGDPAGRSVGLAYVLWFVLGQFSLHRFYCGQKDSAFIQMGLFIGSFVTVIIFPPLGLVGFVIWMCWIVGDLFMIPGMLKKFKAEHDYQGVFA